MGTRGTYGWRVVGEDYLAYNHSDSYPNGLGLSVFRQAQKMAEDPKTIAEKVIRLQTVAPDDLVSARILRRAQVQGGRPPRYRDDINHGQTWYDFLRHFQGNLYDHLLHGIFPLHNTFIEDSLFCEWGYIINFDDERFEVYKGGQKERGHGRYAQEAEDEGQDWWPCSMEVYVPFHDINARNIEDLFIATMKQIQEREQDA